jgi:hypothetical protein
VLYILKAQQSQLLLSSSTFAIFSNFIPFFTSPPQSLDIHCRNLHGNKIQRLPYGLFDNMNSLRLLRLDSNLLECDCSVMWLVKHLQETKHHLNASATCKSPRIMEGKNLLDMTEEELHCSECLIIFFC